VALSLAQVDVVLILRSIDRWISIVAVSARYIEDKLEVCSLVSLQRGIRTGKAVLSNAALGAPMFGPRRSSNECKSMPRCSLRPLRPATTWLSNVQKLNCSDSVERPRRRLAEVRDLLIQYIPYYHLRHLHTTPQHASGGLQDFVCWTIPPTASALSHTPWSLCSSCAAGTTTKHVYENKLCFCFRRGDYHAQSISLSIFTTFRLRQQST